MVLETMELEMSIQDRLRDEGFPQLHVRATGKNLVIYATRRHTECVRAVLTGCSDGGYVLGIANPFGEWRLYPYVGGMAAMMDAMVEELGADLGNEWPDGESGCTFIS